MSEGSVRIQAEDGIATITLDRPDKLNAITPKMSEELWDISSRVNHDDDIRCAVLVAAGGRSFTVGTDVGQLGSFGRDSWELRQQERWYPFAVRQIRKPLIAAVQGYAVGGGLELVLYSDICIATPGSTFGAAEVRLGWHAGSGNTQLLPRAIGSGAAAWMLMSGEPIDAAEAHRLGLVQEVVADDELRARATTMARAIAANPPIAVQLTKHMIKVASNTPLDVGLQWEFDMFSYCMTTRDAQEGIAAFLEQRAPNWTGR